MFQKVIDLYFTCFWLSNFVDVDLWACYYYFSQWSKCHWFILSSSRWIGWWTREERWSTMSCKQCDRAWLLGCRRAPGHDECTHFPTNRLFIFPLVFKGIRVNSRQMTPNGIPWPAARRYSYKRLTVGYRVEGTWDYQDLSMLLNFEIFSKFRADSAAYRRSIRGGIICRGRKRCLTIISDVSDAR